MFIRIFVFLLGFGLTVVGFVFIISYLNLMSLGYNFYEYVNFISKQFECYYALIGLILILFTIFIPIKEQKYELYI
ncbi:MAG: hypothetical protein PHE54_05010 [Bacilli bacterium]|nr:hypothetical protein [Bacilli bacterium]